ncbi:MAG: hypothetical protein OXF11_21875 [Deltaproteobacteria bacterium]|nr:hypothetical protein [Deltaproteobacteria bacterium]
MNNVLKKALGFAGALVLSAGMVLAASPVQASDVDARIQVLERELAQLKQNQESALAAEMKGPSFKYKPGGGLTIAAADNNWSIRFTQRLQVYHTVWLSNENPEAGYQNLELRMRRFRPTINVSSQQGFYAVTWLLNDGSDGTAFGGDGYINFDKLNPWLPSFGYGYSPSFAGNTQAGAFRTEDTPLLDGLGIGGQQDGSFVLSWKKLPGMGISQISHLQLAWGQDNQSETGAGDDGNSVGFALGLKPLAKAKGMGGLSVSSLSYSIGYQAHTDTSSGVRARTPNLANRPNLINIGAVNADTTYVSHGLGWSPLKWLSFSANFATYERDPGSGVDVDASDVRLAARIWLWGPKSGMMGGSKGEGGIYVAPLYNTADIDYDGGSSEVTNSGLAVVYNVPGGWMQVHGVWDSFGCEGACPGESFKDVITEEGEDSFNTFTIAIEYKF